MRVAIATVSVPFIRGGAEAMTRGLQKALIDHGHQTEIISLPFIFHPLRCVKDNVDTWKGMDFEKFDIGNIDKVVSLKFPAYNLKHSNHTVWLMHQHRSIYELYGTSLGEQKTKENNLLASYIKSEDTRALSSAKAVYTISENVSKRLIKYNSIISTPLYQPPEDENLFFNAGVFPYIYFPSRLERLKRQELLIKAMAYVKEPVSAIISGEGGELENYKDLVLKLGLTSRVKFTGHVSKEQMRKYYAHSLAVFFGPYDEDYGYITLEAMLSEKPVITCKDSGGVTEFVRHNETGYVVEPEPKEIADAINQAWANRKESVQMGVNGKELYQAKNISWDNVVSTLLGGE